MKSSPRLKGRNSLRKEENYPSILEVLCMLFPDPLTQEITTALSLMIITSLLSFVIFTTYACYLKEHTIFAFLYKWKLSVYSSVSHFFLNSKCLYWYV